MEIRCTKKLLDALAIKPAPMRDEPPLFCWHANLITINRRKAVVLTNDHNRYILVLYGLKAKDFENLPQLIHAGLQETLEQECIKPEVVERYLNYVPEMVFTRTKDKSMVARLNKACDTVHFYSRVLKTSSINQPRVNIRASSMMVGVGGDLDAEPYELMFKDLESLTGETIFSCPALVLKVTLELGKHHVWRRVIVPVHITFAQFHHVLQIILGWLDCHLHEFVLPGEDDPAVRLVCSDDAFDYPGDVPMIMDSLKTLADYIPAYRRLDYIYDFGDYWQHRIEVEDVLADYALNYPVCLAGEGDAPPEDVGGESGYEEYLEIISDPDHPEHDDMLRWVRGQHRQPFDLEWVNRRLVGSLRGTWDR